MKVHHALALVFMSITLTAQAQTVDEIVSKYLAKMGGAEKSKNVKTRKMIAVMNMQGTNFSLNMFEKPKAMKRMELKMPGFEAIQVYDGKEAWMLNPAMSKDPIKLDEAQSKEFSSEPFEDSFIDYKHKGHEVTLVGTEEVDGISCFKLQLIKNKNKNNDLDDVKEIYFLDKETYLPVMQIRSKKVDANKVIEIKIYVGDYHEVNGIMFPYFQETKVDGQTIQKITIEKIVLDEPMDDSIFTLSKK